MAESGGSTDKTTARALAFYLPQFHPIPENDEWWGKGFTEWSNVTRAKPQFPGHYQPHIPGELGFYDLRVPEVREAQAALAREHGIHGFVYYHYWFNGRRLLERPFDEVLQSGSPDFPFALCWANEEWTRNWDAMTGTVLISQEYSDEDDLAHIRWLATAFQDDRYIKVDGRPLMLVYRPQLLPDPKRTFALWRDEAKRLGIPDLYLCYVESHGPPKGGPAAFGMDASVGFMPMPRKQTKFFAPLEGTRGLRLFDYQATSEKHLNEPRPDWKKFPSVMVSWDNTARRPYGATAYVGATPHAYEHWLRETVRSVADVPEEENFVFLLAWNEWAEGNHLEPDQQFGRAWLEATKSVLVDGPPGGGPGQPSGNSWPSPDDEGQVLYDYIYDFQHQSAVANAAGLIRDLVPDRSSTVVDLGAGSGIASHALRDVGIGYHGIELHPVAVDVMHERGISASQCDLSDIEQVLASVESIEHIGAFMLLDVLQHLQEPQELLSALSVWAMDHGEPTLVASVPNVAHFDVGLRLLCGRWIPTETGLLDSTHIRFFTEETLANLFERTGWELVAREDFSDFRSDQYDSRLTDAMAVETIGMLRVLSATVNPNASINQYVWALRPTGVAHPPSSYLDAVGLTDAQRDQEPDVNLWAVDNYLASVGILASEGNRRSIEAGYGLSRGKQTTPGPGSIRVTLSQLKQAAMRESDKPSKRARVLDQLHRWVR
jgi:2-polyprenyl-3-methyl-5-hydroxy-6-metoxy-1,4-benzoquinol methylase